VLKAAAKEAASPPGGGDEKLLVESAQRDPRRFADLYEANFERVYAFVARRVHVRVDVEDITSEVFQQALANIGKFVWRGVPFAAWLYRIAANAITNRWQRTSREQGRTAADDPPDPAGHADTEQIEHRARLYRLVATLPTEQHRVIQMRFAEEKSIREIAAAMKRSEGAIKQLQFRAIKNLRAQLDKKPSQRARKAHG
jgi:RNA polymerase sigma-70 factor (ECF subfamily)